MSEARYINAETERLLWGIAAGRCEFEGCNKVLYRHEVTGASENHAQKAHIHAVNPGGARFISDTSEFKNSVDNLMLVCPECHITIDRNEEKYPPELLYEMKRKHESRIYTLTSIGAEFKSHMVYYTAVTAGTEPSVNDLNARNALAQLGRYPTENSPIDISQKGCQIRDIEKGFYEANAENLRRAVASRVLDIVSKGQSIALFALAPQPLLMYLGCLLNDKYNVLVFQCHRREENKWSWRDDTSQVEFHSTYPSKTTASSNIAIVFSLSSSIPDSRVFSVLGEDAIIYKIMIDNPNRDFVTNPNVQNDFIQESRNVLEKIKQNHGNSVRVNVFPSMPASLAVRFGMDYMPKTDNPLTIFDELPGSGFVKALEIGDKNAD